MKHNSSIVRVWDTKHIKRGGIFAICILVVVLVFFITKNNNSAAELSYSDTSTVGSVTGTIVPASCDSNDWRGSYCNSTLNTAECHSDPTLSFCAATQLSCEYVGQLPPNTYTDTGSSWVYAHSGSHFPNDCLTKCPGSTNAFYDPFNDRYMTACPNIKVRFGRNCTTPWGATIITGDYRMAWQASSASTCVQEKRTCTDGVLDGTYQYASCTKTTTSGGGTACFVAGTRITMADGSYKNIEDVKEGDRLMSSNGAVTVEKRLVISYAGNLYAFNGNENYFVTPSHPFMTTEGWKSIDPAETFKEIPDLKVSKLSIGDTLILEGGKTMKLEQLDGKPSQTTVYNFRLDGTHEYYADGFLVHNKMAY